MSELAASLSDTVAYSTDKWLIDRVPWAFWVCALGLVIVLHAGGSGVNGAILALVYLPLLGLAFAGWALTVLIARSGISFLAEFPIHLALFIVVTLVIAVAIAAVGGSIGGTSHFGRLRWSTLINPPMNVFGWMLIYLGIGWVAFAIFRRFYPARPIVMLSPAGVSFHRSWLKELSIPWQDIKGVGPVALAGIPATNPNVIAVTVSKDFYDQHIAPKRRFFEPPGTEYMFRPNGEMMQMALNSAEVAASPEDYRGPLETRWKAFRDQPRSTHETGGSPDPNVVYGRWSIDGSWWQAIQFLAPLAGMIAVVLHARGTG
jgi:hypothetical protein